MDLRRHKELRDGLHIARRSHNEEPRGMNIDSPPVMDVLDQIAGLPALEAHRVLVRSDATTSSSATESTSCSANSNSALCEKPISSSTFTIPIILGVTIPLFGSIFLFLYLHRRQVRRQREEDLNDRTNTMDFGLDHVPGLPGKRKFEEPMDEIDSKEKGRSGRPRQMSLDLEPICPYLLPAELQSSKESLRSLSWTVHQKEDPYRPVVQYLDDGRSSYARSKFDGSSVHTASSGSPSRLQDLSKSELLSNAAKMPRSTPPGPSLVPPPRYNSLPPGDGNRSPVSPGAESSIGGKSPIDDEKMGVGARSPPMDALPKTPSGRGLSPAPSSPQPPSPARTASPNRDSRNGNGMYEEHNSNYMIQGASHIEVPRPAALQNGNRKMPPQPLSSKPTPQQPLPMPFAPADDDYDDYEVTPPSPTASEDTRGRRRTRYSMDVPPDEFAKAGLGAPGFNPNRVSMTLRPLPPRDVGELEDPEEKANRIRSFYKEYFDDSKPPPPGQYGPSAHDDYAMDETTYFDPDTNKFVIPMPYAEPVTRRAMTPPPRAPRFRGPAAARPRMGSMGSMQYPGPRAASSVSQRMPPQAPPKKFAPPQPLTSLPMPSRLGDDSFALMNAADFAPPVSHRERQAGRSESPFGERRPYSPTVRAHTPLVSAFEDLPAMPSPHLLRKSGTFTALDFAPPRKFRDQDTMSDAGSIRSARSGISAIQHEAVRKGAYRVSRLEKDMVGTKDDFMNSLKPKWDAGR